jgi:4-hydroxy-3-methylbut-2-enyl diphosphate reductase
MSEARLVCDYVEGRFSRDAFVAKFAKAASAGFDPDVHLARIGVANQTTMLARESLAIGEEVGQAMARARGEEYRAANFRTFDTICSATQDRQDAVLALLEEPLDLMVVIGGYNSSNTISLAAICAERVPTYHIADPSAIDVGRGVIRYRPAGLQHREAEQADWMPQGRPVTIGVTAGASTPNNKIDQTVRLILASRGIGAEAIG